MPSKTTSCLKRAGIGCAAFMGLIVLLGFLAFLGIKLNPPQPADMQQLSTRETFGTNREGGALAFGESGPESKPVKLDLNLRMVDFQIRPDGKPGEITLDSDYDQANFELKTVAEDKGDHVVYKLDFSSKRSLLGLILNGDDNEVNNKLVLHLPPDMVYDLDFFMRMGQANIDLSGLPIKGFVSDFSMGEMDVRMRQPNPVGFETLKMRHDKGELAVHDYQNLGVSNVDVKSSMGETRLSHSGPVLKDIDFMVRSSFGEFRVTIPDDVNIDANTSVMLGDSRVPQSTKTTDPSRPTVTLNGKASFGELRVTSREVKVPIGYEVEQIVENEGEQAARDFYLAEAAKDRSRFDLGPVSMNNMADRLYRERRYDTARVLIELNLGQHPQHLISMVTYSEVLQAQGDLPAAREWIEKARTISPESWMVRRQTRRLEKAESEQAAVTEESSAEATESADQAISQ